MTARSTWKCAERAVARMFGVRRIALSGSNNTQGETASDTDHPRLFIEVKLRKSFAAWSLFRKVEKLAAKEKKVPVVALKQKGGEGILLVLRPHDLRAVAEEYDNANVRRDETSVRGPRGDDPSGRRDKLVPVRSVRDESVASGFAC